MRRILDASLCQLELQDAIDTGITIVLTTVKAGSEVSTDSEDDGGIEQHLD